MFFTTASFLLHTAQSSPLKSLSQIFIKSKSEWNSKLSIYMYTCSLTLEKTSDINGHETLALVLRSIASFTHLSHVTSKIKSGRKKEVIF